MKNSYIIIIIIVLLVVGGLFFGAKSNKLEAPTVSDADYLDTVDIDVDKKIAPNETLVSDEENNIESSEKEGVVKEFTITGQNFSFAPNVIKVKKGDKVKITFVNTQGFHDFKIDEFDLATVQAQSPSTEVLEFIADKVGNFEYYCSVGSHRALGMEGSLVVE